jgi:RimJ/RimL family protein N-acetyltransferase
MEAAPVCLKGPRVTIRPLTRDDLDAIAAWPPSTDPLYKLFDWPAHSLIERAMWFSHLMHDQTRVYYAVEDEVQRLIGRLSLREIQGHDCARMGIGFGAPFVGQGYGTEALGLFLGYYFMELGFERIVLDVAAINERAIRCYERCGFQYVGSHYQGIGDREDIAFLERKEYRHLARFFQISRYRSRMLFYDMALDRSTWLEWQRGENDCAGTSTHRSARTCRAVGTSAKAR